MWNNAQQFVTALVVTLATGCGAVPSEGTDWIGEHSIHEVDTLVAMYFDAVPADARLKSLADTIAWARKTAPREERVATLLPLLIRQEKALRRFAESGPDDPGRIDLGLWYLRSLTALAEAVPEEFLEHFPLARDLLEGQAPYSYVYAYGDLFRWDDGFDGLVASTTTNLQETVDEELERALRRGQRERLLTGVTLSRTSLRGHPAWRALDPDQKRELREQLMRGDDGAAILTLSVPNPWQELAEVVAEEFAEEVSGLESGVKIDVSSSDFLFPASVDFPPSLMVRRELYRRNLQASEGTGRDWVVKDTFLISRERGLSLEGGYWLEGGVSAKTVSSREFIHIFYVASPEEAAHTAIWSQESHPFFLGSRDPRRARKALTSLPRGHEFWCNTYFMDKIGISVRLQKWGFSIGQEILAPRRRFHTTVLRTDADGNFELLAGDEADTERPHFSTQFRFGFFGVYLINLHLWDETREKGRSLQRVWSIPVSARSELVALFPILAYGRHGVEYFARDVEAELDRISTHKEVRTGDYHRTRSSVNTVFNENIWRVNGGTFIFEVKRPKPTQPVVVSYQHLSGEDSTFFDEDGMDMGLLWEHERYDSRDWRSPLLYADHGLDDPTAADLVRENLRLNASVFDPARAEEIAHARGEALVALGKLDRHSWEDAARAYLVVARIREDEDDLVELLDSSLEAAEFEEMESERIDLIRELASEAGVEGALAAYERERDAVAGGEGRAKTALFERARAAGIATSEAAPADSRRLGAFAFQAAYLALADASAARRVEENHAVLLTFTTPKGEEERGFFFALETNDDIEEAGAFVEFFCRLRDGEKESAARFERIRNALLDDGFGLGTVAALIRLCGAGAENVTATLRLKTGEQTCLSRADPLAGLPDDARPAYEVALPRYRRLLMLQFPDRKSFLIRDHRAHQPSRDLR